MAPYQSDEQSGYEGSILQPGFRFQPTDEELVCFYLTQKVENNNVAFEFIGEVDFNTCEPWDLWAWAKTGGRLFYFFSTLEKKYASGGRTNRATEAGFWKGTGKDRKIINSCTGRFAGWKKTLIFYIGRAPKAEKTGWTMYEYRIEGESTVADQQDWVVCQVFDKGAPSKNKLRSSPSGFEYLFQKPSSSNSVIMSASAMNMDTDLIPSDPQASYPDVTHSGHGSHDSTLLTGSDSWVKVTRSDFGLGDSFELANVDELGLLDSLESLDLTSPQSASYCPDWASWDVISGPSSACD